MLCRRPDHGARLRYRIASDGTLEFSLNEVPIGISFERSTASMRLVHAAATEMTLFSKVYDLGAALKIGVIGKTAAPGQLPDEAVGCFAPAQFFRPARSRNAPCRRRRWPQSTPQRDPIEIGYRVACQIEDAPRYREPKAGAAAKNPRHGLAWVMNWFRGKGESPLLPQLQT